MELYILWSYILWNDDSSRFITELGYLNILMDHLVRVIT